MISSLPLSSAHVHKPLIRFLGKRVFNTPAPVATFHPLAPEDIKSKFSEFLHHRQHPSQSVRAQDQDPGRSGSSKENVIWYDDPSQLPWKYITPTQNEIDLINGGGVIQWDGFFLFLLAFSPVRDRPILRSSTFFPSLIGIAEPLGGNVECMWNLSRLLWWLRDQ